MTSQFPFLAIFHSPHETEYIAQDVQAVRAKTEFEPARHVPGPAIHKEARHEVDGILDGSVSAMPARKHLEELTASTIRAARALFRVRLWAHLPVCRGSRQAAIGVGRSIIPLETFDILECRHDVLADAHIAHGSRAGAMILFDFAQILCQDDMYFIVMAAGYHSRKAASLMVRLHEFTDTPLPEVTHAAFIGRIRRNGTDLDITEQSFSLSFLFYPSCRVP